MAAHLFERAPLTTGLITELRTLGFPVGDNSSPTDADNNAIPFGWQGEPDAAGTNFVPWISVTAMTAGPAPGTSGSGSLDTLSDDAFWVANYSIYAAGVNRDQSETLMDRARNLLCNLGVDSPFTVEGQVATWTIAGIACPNLGSNNRVGEAIPYYYTQTDNYQVWVTEGD